VLSGGNATLETHFFQNYRYWAKAGESGLKQVEANENCKPEPVSAELICQQKGEKDCKTCEGQNDTFDTHDD
jgi:hypothetical protein